MDKQSLTVTINLEIEPSDTFKALAEMLGYEKTKPSKSELAGFRRDIEDFDDGEVDDA